jgi:hypothetical protein
MIRKDELKQSRPKASKVTKCMANDPQMSGRNQYLSARHFTVH